ncbi:MAG: tetratricopeptide repeat protein [Thiomicrorhabdus sp.]|nr:tetratricopeptide repeat protein [Thiomicrorhabdus sp.]
MRNSIHFSLLSKSVTKITPRQSAIFLFTVLFSFNVQAVVFNDNTCDRILKNSEANQVCHQALKGDPAASYAMSRLFADSKNSPLINLEYAYFWHLKLARQVLEQNLSDSAYTDILYNTGVLYNDGLGTQKDLKKAFFWFTKAAERGHALAMLQLSQTYFNGVIVPKDDKQALNWLKKSVALNNPEAQIVMAQQYLTGNAVEQDQTKAIELLKKAAEQNSAKANFILGNYYLANSTSLQDKLANQAKNHYGLSCKLDFLLGCKRYYDLDQPNSQKTPTE